MSTNAPNLLGADGSASMATGLMMSHHGFRRDLALFARALRGLAAGEPTRVASLQEEWKSFHGTLHGHHDAEDTRMFPHLRGEHPELDSIIAGLTEDHRHIDPLLADGDRAFAQLPDPAPALALVSRLAGLLDPHLAIEEQHIVQHLRQARGFPPPQNEEEANMYVQGFAWSSQGIAPDILEKVDAMLPEALQARMPAARVAFQERCRRVWGTVQAGASRTPVPDWLAAEER